MVYWFMRMKQGSEGKDFTSELWNQNLIGIMFGTWTIHHVSDGAGGIDERKLTLEHLSNYRPNGEPVFKKNWLDTSRRFLIEMVASDKVVVEFDGSLHIATVTDEFEGNPGSVRPEHREHFKCRRIRHPKDFPLEKLPSSYRLISSTGRGAVQKINAYKPLVEMLDRYDSPKAVTEACHEMPTEQLLEILAPKQWEAICAEYLRHTEEVKPLLLAVGSTLKTIDIYGVNRDGKRVLAQCKNDAKARDAQTIIEWLDALVADPDDILYFFARKGAKEGVPESKCRIVDDTEILRWLRLPSQKDYETYLKTL